MLKILVKEDMAIYREGISEIVKEEFEKVKYKGIAGDAELAIAILQNKWDVIVVGTMNFQETLLSLSFVKKNAPDTPVIILEYNAQEEKTQQVLAAGAVVYLSKNSPASYLINAIRMAINPTP